MNDFEELSEKHEEIAKKIVEAAYRVHKALGPGLLESVYEKCFVHELRKMGCEVQSQVPVPIDYDDLRIDEAFRADVLVDDLVISELKAVVDMKPVFEAQILTHMKLMKKRLGFLINFNVPVIKRGMKRFILQQLTTK